MKIIEKKGLVNSLIMLTCVVTFLIGIVLAGGNRFWLFVSGGGKLQDYTAASYSLVCSKHEYWRLILCGYVHNGIFHLCANVYLLWCLGDLVEKRIGSLKYFIVYHVGMALSTFIWCQLFRNATMVGASIGIFVVLGLFFVWYKSRGNIVRQQISKGSWNYIIGYCVLGNVLWPLSTAIHAISFLIGSAVSILLKRPFRSSDMPNK